MCSGQLRYRQLGHDDDDDDDEEENDDACLRDQRLQCLAENVFIHSPLPAELILAMSVNCSVSGLVCHPVFRREESAMNESDSQCYLKRRMPLTTAPLR